MMEVPFKLTPRQAIRITIEFVVLGLVVGAGIYGAYYLGERVAGFPPMPDLMLELIAIPISVVWTIVRALRRHGVRWSQLVVWRVEPWMLFAPFLLMVLGDAVMVSAMDNVMEAFLPSPDWLRDLMREVMDVAARPITAFAVVVVLAPLTEEAVMRGIVLRGLLGGTSARRAIVISAALFAAMHLNPWQMPGAFVGGLILGWAYLRTRSLGLCVAGHALHNALCLFAGSLPFEIPGFNTVLVPGQVTPIQPWWFTLSGVGLFIAGAAWFHSAAPPARPFLSPVQPESSASPKIDLTQAS